MTIFGVDVANYQKGLKVTQLKDQGYGFLIAKATEGRGVKDPSYRRFLAEAKAAGVPFAAYHFLRSDSSIAAQVANLAAQIGDKSVPVMIDCEVAGASRPTLAMCKAFRTACAAKGIRVSMLYLPRFWWQQIGRPSLEGWTLVQALYGNNPTGYGSATYPGDRSTRWAPMGGVTPTILQFGSNGRIDGYPGRVDVDAYRGTRDQLLASRLFQTWGKAPTAPTPIPAPPVEAEEIVVDDEHPLVKLGDFRAVEGKWTTFATDYIAAKDGVKYLLSVQTRHAPGQRLQTRAARLGWGADAASNTEVDGTFYTDEEARPYEHSHTYGGHPINGGGPIAFQVRAHGSETVPTLIAKVTPIVVAK